MQAKKLLLLSVSAGAGHMRAAQAIGAYASTIRLTSGLPEHASDQRTDDTMAIDVTHLDVMDYVTAGLRQVYTKFYMKLLNKAPSLWGYLYKYSNHAQSDGAMEKIRRKIERMNARALLRAIQKEQADAIICTHFLPAEILSRLLLKNKIKCPVWVQITDFDLHRMWLHEGISGYFVATEEISFRMQAQGIPVENIHVSGIPVMPEFSHTMNRLEIARELGINPDKKTFLLMGGGAGLGCLETLAERLLNLEFDVQLLVLAGKNASTLAILRELMLQFPGRLLAFGYTDQVHRLMACSDIVISKPGGLTASEALALGIPMILNTPIPGQEEGNADYLLEQGVALKAADALSLEYRIRYLLEHPEKLSDMQRKARALGRPHAAQTVFNLVTGKHHEQHQCSKPATL